MFAITCHQCVSRSDVCALSLWQTDPGFGSSAVLSSTQSGGVTTLRVLRPLAHTTHPISTTGATTMVVAVGSGNTISRHTKRDVTFVRCPSLVSAMQRFESLARPSWGGPSCIADRSSELQCAVALVDGDTQPDHHSLSDCSAVVLGYHPIASLAACITGLHHERYSPGQHRHICRHWLVRGCDCCPLVELLLPNSSRSS